MLIKLLILSLTITLFAQPNYPRTYEKAEVKYDDVDTFLKMFSTLSSSSNKLDHIQKEYLDKGSIGLKEYISRHSLTADKILTAINENPEKYKKIKAFRAKEKTYNDKFQIALKKFHNVIPNPMYPPTYLIVGAHRGIGQASKYGQLVTITRRIEDLDILVTLNIHELSHFQNAMNAGFQNYQGMYKKKDNHLDMILREGLAEFITYLSTGHITNRKGFTYLNENEADVWTQFKSDHKNGKLRFWMYESSKQSKLPFMMGYAMGYAVAKKYYDSQEDKSAAIMNLLKSADRTLYPDLEKLIN